jgi:uncharacterized OsmC-like protein
MQEASRRFEVNLDWRGPDGTALSSPGAGSAIAGAGAAAEGRGWRPEELLLGALGLCLTRTFQSLAAREGLHVERCHTRVEATLTATPYGERKTLGFTLLTAHFEVSVPPDQAALARDLAVQAKQYCIVANALMPPLHLELAVESVSSLAAASSER